MFGLGVNRLGATNQKPFSPASLFNNGEAGVWYDPSAASGSLDWRKNLFEYTESFDNSYWSKLDGATVNPNVGIAPNGTQTADRLNFSTSGSSRVENSVSGLGSNVTVSYSVWLKSESGNQNLQIGTSGASKTNVTATTEWQRFTHTATDADGAVYPRVENSGDGVARSVLTWGAQLEEASTASSYQPILSTFENAFKTAFPSHTLYQDYQGVTPVTAVGQPVGLMLDKSEGLAQGPELVTNGDFATDSGWTKSANWSIANGVATSDNSVLSGVVYQPTGTTSGSYYRVTFDITAYTSGGVIGRVGNVRSTELKNTIGTHTVLIKSDGQPFIGLEAENYFTGSIDNVSVTEIQGSHATQPTSTKRPIYARHPEDGIRNLLNYTEQLDNPAWIKTSMSVVANQTIAPDGTQTADKFTPVGGGIHLFGLNHFIGAGNNTASVYMKKGTGRYGGIRLVNDAFGNDRYSVLIDLETGSFVSDYSTGNPPVKAYKIDDSGNGWYRLSVMLQHSTSTMNVSVFTNNDNTPDWATTALPEYTANGTDYIYAWGAQLEEATEASNYQKVVTDIDVTESGVGEVYYLKFDGVDDGMFINNLTSSSTPLTALFGYSATNAESGDDKYLVDIQSGRLALFAMTNNVGEIGYYNVPEGYVGFDAGDANAIKVLTYDLLENDAKIRIDGTQEYSNTNFHRQPLGGTISLFERHANSQGRLAGNMYQTILRAAESTDEEIAKAETYVANKTGLKAQVDGIATLDLNFGNNTYTAKNSNGGVI